MSKICSLTRCLEAMVEAKDGYVTDALPSKRLRDQKMNSVSAAG